MNEHPSVDILLATYDGERYISEQIESIVAQDHTNWRLLVSDDGSLDATTSLVLDYAARDDRIQLLNTRPSHSATENFLGLLAYSRADYAMFCDQDDYWLPSKVTSSLERMTECEGPDARPTVISGDAVVVNEERDLICSSFLKLSHISTQRTTLNKVLVQSPVLGCSAMMNRSLVDLVVSSPPNFSNVRWHDWWVALVAASFGTVSVLEQPLLEYRQHGANQVGTKKYSFAGLFRDRATGVQRTEQIYRQAVELMGRFGDDMPSRSRSMVERFISAHEQNVLTNARMLIGGGYLKSGTVRAAVHVFIASTAIRRHLRAN